MRKQYEVIVRIIAEIRRDPNPSSDSKTNCCEIEQLVGRRHNMSQKEETQYYHIQHILVIFIMNQKFHWCLNY